MLKNQLRSIIAVPLALALVASTALSPSIAHANGGNTITPLADAYVSSAHPNNNYGSSARLWIDNDTDALTSYLKFDVRNSVYDGHNACEGGVFSASSANLDLTIDDVSGNGHEIWVTDPSWTETGLTYNNRPAVTGASAAGIIYSADEDSVNDSAIYTIDGAAIDQACNEYGGILSLVIKGGSTNALAFKSKEGSISPTLAVIVGD